MYNIRSRSSKMDPIQNRFKTDEPGMVKRRVVGDGDWVGAICLFPCFCLVRQSNLKNTVAHKILMDRSGETC